MVGLSPFYVELWIIDYCLKEWGVFDSTIDYKTQKFDSLCLNFCHNLPNLAKKKIAAKLKFC
jgi:hypothetical protein